MLKFKCPECGCEKLECCMDGPHSCPVTEIDESGDFEYGAYESSADVDRWQCECCGYILPNVFHNEEVVEWIRNNC